ncbi:MAG: glycosyltransferase [Planctomycetota bacterium]|jgi:trehalose synthase
MIGDAAQDFSTNAVDRYASLVGTAEVARLKEKARTLSGRRIQHINATKHGGGVAEILLSLIPLARGLGVDARWSVIEGDPGYFEVTKRIHNLLQGGKGGLSEADWQLYMSAATRNAHIVDPTAEIVVVHDPQPLHLIGGRNDGARWIWRCHLDLTETNESLWRRLAPMVDRYDHTIFSLPDYRQPAKSPASFILPAIDPFAPKNIIMPANECRLHLRRYGIPTDLPIVTQISRFDPWKHPLGVIEASRLARRNADHTLVLLGNMASDDPEGERIYHALARFRDERTFIMAEGDDHNLVNALQCSADVVMQKSIREGFGLTVTEALWKRRAVIAGGVGGIIHQIEDGENGFLVDTVEAAAARIVQLLRDPGLQTRLGAAGRETVRQRFLLLRLLEQELDVLSGA